MIRRSKATFLSALAVTGVAGAFLLGSIVLRSSIVQKRAAESISRLSGMEVRFESFKPAIFTRTRVSNLAATNHRGDSIFAREAKARISLWHLLSGRLVFREIYLDGVRVVRMESQVPRAPEASVEKAPEAGAAAASEQPGGPPHSLASQALDKRRAQQLGALRLVKISNVSLDWQTTEGRTKLAVEGADASLQIDRTGMGSGKLHLGAVTWMELVRCSDLNTVLAINDGILSLNDLQAVCGSGKIRGSSSVVLKELMNFNIRLEAEGVDLEKMTADLPTLRLSGNAAGEFHMEGPLLDDAGWTGAAGLQVREGSFKGVSLLQMLGQVFQIQELANLKVRNAKLSARIGGRKLTLEDFLLQSPDVELSAPGEVGFDGKLALGATLRLQERLLGSRVMQLVGNSFSAANAEGQRSIAFRVGGSLEKPSTNLMEKVVGEGLGGVLNQVLGGFLKPRKTEPKDQPAPTKDQPAPK